MELNREQRMAVECLEGPCLVIAPAGTGKTKVLTERIIYLIEKKNVDPNSILAITFTNLAGNEMQERIRRRLSIDKLPDSIGTIHAIFSEILSRDIEKLDIGFNHDFEVLTEDAQRKFLKRAIKNLPDVKIHNQKLKDIASAINKWKIGECLGIDLLTSVERFKVRDIVPHYQQELNERKYLDFDDILIYSYKLLTQFPELREYWKSRYKYILVDECQDLNEIQFRLINFLLPDKKPNFFAVGDPNQCIYIFNGAKENIFEEYEEKFKDDGLQVVRLVTNYRSDKDIVDLSNKIKSIPYLSESNSFSKGEILNSPVLSPDLINTLISSNDLSQWAILFNKNSKAEAIVKSLIENNINFRASRFRLLEEQTIENILNLVKVIYFDNSHPLNDFIWKSDFLPPTDRKAITSMDNFQENQTLFEFLVHSDNWKNICMSEEAEERLVNLLTLIREFRNMPKDNLSSVVDKILRCRIYPVNPIRNVRDRIDLFVKWLDNIQPEKTLETAEDILKNIKIYSEISKEDLNKKKHNSLTLSTIYKTKGLEWDNVIVLDYKYLKKEAKEPKSNDKYLAYVAITRAKNRLFLIENAKG